MRIPTTTLLAIILAVILAIGLAAPVATVAGHHEEPSPASLLDLEARRLGGEVEPLDRYRGQVLLVVNTASRCGYTPQYEGLQDLHEKYRERGFSVLGFPSNDFGKQEPGSAAEIGAFCKKNFGVEFPMFDKVKVNGEGAHPVYAFLTSRPAPVGGPVRWNFEKYLVDREGKVRGRFASSTAPGDPALTREIERFLAESDALE